LRMIGVPYSRCNIYSAYAMSYVTVCPSRSVALLFSAFLERPNWTLTQEGETALTQRPMLFCSTHTATDRTDHEPTCELNNNQADRISCNYGKNHGIAVSHPYRSNPQAQEIRTYGGPCYPIASPRT